MSRPFPVVVAGGHGKRDTGAMAGTMVERDLVGGMAWYAVQRLRAAEWVAVQGPQSGPAVRNDPRVQLANELRAVLVVQHLNSGGGRYGLVEYAADNPQSRRLAEFLAARYREALGDLVTEVQVWSLERGQRGWVCVGGCRRSAVIAEPLFLDTPAHREWLREHENRAALAQAVANAVEDLGRSVTG